MLCLTGLSDSLFQEHRMWYIGLVILHDVDSFTCVLGEFCRSWLAGCKQEVEYSTSSLSQ